MFSSDFYARLWYYEIIPKFVESKGITVVDVKHDCGATIYSEEILNLNKVVSKAVRHRCKKRSN